MDRNRNVSEFVETASDRMVSEWHEKSQKYDKAKKHLQILLDIQELESEERARQTEISNRLSSLCNELMRQVYDMQPEYDYDLPF